MKQKSILLDLVGPSGSGKSTFTEMALKYSNKFENIEMAAFRGLTHHPTVYMPFKSLLRLIPARLAYKLRLTKFTELYIEQTLKLKEMKSYTPFLEYVLKTIHKLGTNQQEKHWLIRRVQVAVVQHYLSSLPDNKNKIILADEFLLQKIFPMHNLTLQFQKYINLLPSIDGALCFNTETNICKHRIRTRQLSKTKQLRELKEVELDKMIASSKQNTKVIQSLLETQGLYTVEINSSKDLESYFKILLNLLQTNSGRKNVEDF